MNKKILLGMILLMAIPLVLGEGMFIENNETALAKSVYTGTLLFFSSTLLPFMILFGFILIALFIFLFARLLKKIFT
jgi:hypothetical protein